MNALGGADRLNALGLLAGGMGHFLPGMGLTTDGLRLAAGPTLHHILADHKTTRWHALSSGVLVTAAMRLSSAVTVATIGFVNAGQRGCPPMACTQGSRSGEPARAQALYGVSVAQSTARLRMPAFVARNSAWQFVAGSGAGSMRGTAKERPVTTVSSWPT